MFLIDSLLSVVLIAKKNTSLSLLRGLNSILKQIYTPIEVIVVDANEPDSMYSLGLQEDLSDFQDITYLKLEQSLSMAEIRNRAMEYARGEFIAFLTSNDTWDTTKALLSMDQLQSNPEVAASLSNGILFDERKADLSVNPLIEHVTYDSSSWILYNPAKMPAQVIYRLQALRDVGGFDPRFCNFGDGDMLLQLVKKHKILILPVSLCECRIAQDNEAYEWNDLRDDQIILDKYLDIFLINKRMTRSFYVRMMQLAKGNYLWLNYLVYALMYFIKAPGKTLVEIVVIFTHALGYLLKWLRLQASLFREGLCTRKVIRFMKKGRFPEFGEAEIVDEETEDKPVGFASARQFHEQGRFHYVFDHTLKSIVIPEYVTVIKKYMFYHCDSLILVEIPNTVTEIQAHAFQGCRNLRRVVFQKGSRLSKIDAYAFADCSALKSMNLSAAMLRIGKYAFFHCSSLTELQFTYMQHGEEKKNNAYPTALVTIPRYAFAGCSNLLMVEFDADSMLKSIEKGAFLGCGSLLRILITGSVQALGRYAFAYCRKLESVTIPQIDAVGNIGKCAFMYCESMAYIQLPNQLEHINERTFYGSGLKSVKIPRKVIYINHQAFAKCTLLEKAVILTGNASISPTAFEKHTEVLIAEEE